MKPAPIPFIKNVAGTSGEFTTEGISEQLRNFVITKFTDYLGESKIAALDLAANMNEFSQELTIGLKDDFAEYGIELTSFGREYFVARGCGRGIRPPHKHGRDWQYDRLYPDAVCRFVERFGKQSRRRWQPCRRCDGCRYWTGYGRTNGGADDESTSRTVSRRATATSTGCTYSTPMPQQTTYHVAVGGVQQGPFPVSQLQQMIQQGQLTRDTLVWTAGMPAWPAANSVQELSQLFARCRHHCKLKETTKCCSDYFEENTKEITKQT